MAVIFVRTVDSSNGVEVRGSALRTGSAEAAVDQAVKLKSMYSEPAYTTRILYSGDFVDPAFAELSQLVQQHGLQIEISDP